MKLTFKFNLIFVLVFGLGLLATGFVARDFLQRNARTQVTQEARLMLRTSGAVRNYTAEEVRPILGPLQKKGDVFFAPSVPAFSAIRMFKYLHNSMPDYSYREPALNPTNPSDRAVDWEADVINSFRNDSNLKELVNTRETATGKSLFIATPMQALEECMPCHSTPQAAPPAMVKIYGPNNGFGWKVGETVAARIVSVPMAVPEAIANGALWTLMFWLAAIAVVSLVLLNGVLVFAVIRPVGRLAKSADEISKGNLDVPELPVQGKDEVSVLADAFNRMHRSLAKAMKMLEE